MSRISKLIVAVISIAAIALLAVGSALIFFKVGGSAKFDILGQEFSSTNIGFAVIAASVGLVIYLVYDLRKHEAKTSKRNSRTYTELSEKMVITWDEFFDAAQKLVLDLTSSTGFLPDVVIGVCGGGLIVADIVGKRLGHIPCLALWPNRHSSKTKNRYLGEAESINGFDLDKIIENAGVRRILILDDVVYSGGTLSEAVEYIRKKSKHIRSKQVDIRTAALFLLSSATFKPDFYVIRDSGMRRMMPVSDRLRTIS